MKHKTRKLFSIFLALVMVLGLAPAMSLQARADDAKGGTRAAEDGTFAELQVEINANSGETITLTKNYLCEDGFDDNGIHIGSGKTITIDLAGFRIDGMEESRVFSVSGNLTIKDSSTSSTGKITGGRADNGGGIYVDKNASLTVEGGTITGNSVPGNGGGIYVDENASLTVGGTIAGNSASGAGGGIYVLGSLTMTGGFVDDNEAEGAGGGIFADAGSSTELTNVTITQNVAASYGGGICVDKNADLTVEGGTIAGNSVPGNGGGIYVDEKASLTVKSGTITGNSASGAGGGIYVLGSLTMTGGFVEDNEAEGAGGGIFADAGSSAELTNVTITQNVAGSYGGGVCVLSKNTVQIKSCSITGNEAGLDGGGIFLEDGSVSLQGSSVSDNTALRGGGVFIDTSAESVGIEGRLTIAGNTASFYGSDVFLESGKKLTCTDELIEGTAIGVELEDGAGVFTKDYGTKNASVEPSAYFTVKETYRVFRNGDGEAEIAPRLKTIQLGAGGIKQYDTVYMGTYKADDETIIPVPWFALNTDGFMLSKYTIGTSIFRVHGDDRSYYDGSVLQDTMNRLYNGEGTTLFQPLERGAIKETILGGASMYTGQSDVSARLFPLSLDEAGTIGWGSDLLKAWSINAPEGHAGWWWLRSSPDDTYAYCLSEDGLISIDRLVVDLDVRPAFHLNLESVLFTSAAENGKDGSLGTLSAVGDYTGREWKLTLKDESRKFAVTEASATAAPGETLTLNYTGATVYDANTAPNEYISAILTDKDGNLLRYGRLTQPDETGGEVDVKIPADLADGTYTLKVFSEQYNGDYKTDYAGEFDEVTLTVANVTKYDVWVGGTQVDETNLNDILNDGGKAKYDPATGTLTLNNPTITTVHPDESAVIFCAEDGSFTVTGTAALNVSGAEYGLRYQGEGDLTVNGDISATGVNGGISAPHANISITGGTVEATATFAASPDNPGGCTALSTEGKLTVTGGALTANAIGGGRNVGIYAQGGVEISGGELTAQGNQYGISVGESANITFANGTKAVWALGNAGAITMGNGVISIGDRLGLRLPDDSGYHSIAGVELNDDKNEVLDGSGRTAKVVNILPVGFTVTFDPNGGNVTPTSGTTGADGKLTSLPTPTRSGSYRFDGWYTEKTGGTKVDDNTVFSANDTIYAHWAYTGGGSGGGSATTKYTLTYNTNGGNSITATKHNKNATVNLTATPTREGYDFTGWFADKELKNAVTSVKMDGDKTVYAGWKEAVPAEETPLLVVTINSMKYLLNGKPMTMDSAPFIDGNNRTMLPVRVIANALGITNDNIKWDSATKTAFFTRADGKVVSCTVNSNVIQIGDEKVTIDTVPVIRNSRIYLPMRALFNAFDVPDENILWDAAARTVTVTKKD